MNSYAAALILGLAFAALVDAESSATAQEPAKVVADPKLDRLRGIVRTAFDEQAKLRASLAERQRELSEVYALYDLDDADVDRLHGEILDLQSRLLASHRKMQKELREVVDAERFETLSRRIDNALRTAPPAQDARAPESDR